VVLDDVAAVDGLDAALTRLDRLSDEDLAWQVTLIRGALHAGAGGARAPRTATEDRRLDPEAIARTVIGAAFDDADGHPAWLVATPVGDGRRLQLGVIGDGLYDGRAGVAAFLYACGERERARATLAPVLAALDAAHEPRSAYVRSLGLGLAGAGGLLRLFLFLEAHAPRDGAWSDYAAAIVRAVSPEAIRRSRELDLLAGPVGLAKPLAALLGRPGCEPAEGLLECIVEGALAAVDQRTGGWPNAAGVALTGLAHGASGVVVALAEACLALGSLPALDAVLGGVGYERGRYLAAGGWADLRRRSAPPRFMHAWCHGTVGIALARARLCELIPGHAEVWARDLELAVERALAEPLTEHDHLCCGNVGRIAVLAHVGRSAGRPDWVERVRRLEADCLAAPSGWRTLTAGGRDAVPGLMTGLAGVGMHALFEGDSAWVEALLL
jgi:lantibiotic modifying enzyme